MANYLLDTNVFDFLLNENINIKKIKYTNNYYITNVQYSEIINIPDEIKRKKLCEILDILAPKKLLLKSGIWIDDLLWDDEQIWIDEINKNCIELTGNTVNKPWKDALTREVAKEYDIILITNDKKFSKIAKLNNIKTDTPENIFL